MNKNLEISNEEGKCSKDSLEGAVGGTISPVLEYIDSLEQENRNFKVSQSFFEAIKLDNEKLRKTTEMLKEKLQETERSVVTDSRLCKICMDNELEVTFVPCGHLMSCVDCSPVLKNCPICRKPIKGCVRTYL